MSQSRFSGASVTNLGPRTLYLSENHQVVMYEVGALYADVTSPISDPKWSWAILSLRVILHSVADLSNPNEQKLLRTNSQQLTGGWINCPGVPPTHQLGAALHGLPGLEGLLYPSARGNGRNLVVYPDKLGPGSEITFLNEQTGKPETLA